MILSTSRRARGQAIVLLIILLAILGGGYWWLVDSARKSEAEARAFARDTVTRMAIQFDRKFVDSHFASEAQVQFPPSFRERMLYNLRELGVPAADFEMDGQVMYTSHFFDPRGQFRAPLKYPTKSAELDVAVSQPHGWWQIDNLNLTWNAGPAAPVPAPLASPAASPAVQR